MTANTSLGFAMFEQICVPIGLHTVGNELAYTFTAPSDGFYNFRVDAPDSAFDSTLAIIDSADDCGGPIIACNDDIHSPEIDEADRRVAKPTVAGPLDLDASSTGGTGGDPSSTADDTMTDPASDTAGGSGEETATGDTSTSHDTAAGTDTGGTGSETSTGDDDTAGSDTGSTGSTSSTSSDTGDDDDDDEPPIRQSQASRYLTAGQTVIVLVDSKDATPYDFTLTASRLDGENCPDHVIEMGQALPVSVSGDTSDQTNSMTGSCLGGAPDLLYQWTAPAAGLYTIDTRGSSTAGHPDTILYVLEGDCAGKELACSDDIENSMDRDSSVTLELAAAQSIIIVVDGWTTRAGPFTLNIANAE
ncbi:MAG: hypothetical protein B7733_20365 [Myxococcales bacterium FL481]|nr:MAG: hypothetical protein B7733_20365 [Myxococcales bacterium FL481]